MNSNQQPQPQGQKILLVEDEDLIRDLYARQLTKAGFIVKSVADGNSAISELDANSFDLVLLDIMLPGMNGLQILQQFKQKNPNSPTKVVMLTNLGQETAIKEGFQLGASAYLIKASYTPDQVVAEIKNVLSGNPANPAPTV